MSQLELWKKSFDPFRELSVLPRQFDRMFEDFYFPQLRQKLEMAKFVPELEVHESKAAYSVKVDLPGMTKEDIKIDLHEGSLTVSGERKFSKKAESEDHKTHISETSYGSFTRSLKFPEAVDAEKVEAKYENGVLEIEIPKKDSTPKRQISIR